MAYEALINKLIKMVVLGSKIVFVVGTHNAYNINNSTILI